MKLRRIFFVLSVLVLIGSFSLTAYAADNDGVSASRPFRGVRASWAGRGENFNLTDEQKAELRGRMSEMQSFVESVLTDEHRAAIAQRQAGMTERRAEMRTRRADMESRSALYGKRCNALQNNLFEARIAVINRLVQAGVIDSDMAQNLADRFDGRPLMREGRECERTPSFGRGMRGGFGNR